MDFTKLKVINSSKIVYEDRIVAELHGYRTRFANGTISRSDHSFTIDGDTATGFAFRSDAIRYAKLEVMRRHQAGTLKGKEIVRQNIGRPVSIHLGSTRMMRGKVIKETENTVTVETPQGNMRFSSITHYKIGDKKSHSTSRFSYDDNRVL